MAVGQTDVAEKQLGQNLLTLFSSLREQGTGPGGTPHGELRQVFSQLAGNMIVPNFAFGSSGPIADESLDYEVELWFKPKLVLVYLEGTNDFLYLKHAAMGTGLQTELKALQAQVATDADLAAGSFLKLEQESDTATPKNANAFTVAEAAIPANNDKLHWFALG